ncbi:MAG: AMP-binding protein, partial [Chloroflexota bacterium]
MVTYADRPWTKKYDPGVPTTLHPYPDISMSHFLQESARKSPNNLALTTSTHLPLVGRAGSDLTYGQLNEASDALASALVDLGLKKGDRVAIVMPNVAAFVIAYFGIFKAGGVVAATNPTYPAERMREQINDCGAEFVITLTLFYNTVKQIQAQTKIKTVIVT